MFRVCPISDNPGITKASQEEAKLSSCPQSRHSYCLHWLQTLASEMR